MDTIIEAINEYRQKLLIKKTEADIAILYRLEDYLKEAHYYMSLAKRTIVEHNIEL
jgi:hypothetical protein